MGNDTPMAPQIRTMTPADWPAVRSIYAAGIGTADATLRPTGVWSSTPCMSTRTRPAGGAGTALSAGCTASGVTSSCGSGAVGSPAEPGRSSVGIGSYGHRIDMAFRQALQRCMPSTPSRSPDVRCGTRPLSPPAPDELPRASATAARAMDRRRRRNPQGVDSVIVDARTGAGGSARHSQPHRPSWRSAEWQFGQFSTVPPHPVPPAETGDVR
jgi:hypothetical protein